MKIVSRFEAKLLKVLQCFLRRSPLDHALAVITSQEAPPECLSRDAVELVQDNLAKGCSLILARAGGWRREQHLRGQDVIDGRLWERTTPSELGLTFSRHSLRFLIWITAHKPGDEKPKWSAREEELTQADCLFFYLAYSALRETEVAHPLRTRPGFWGNSLCRLAFSEDFQGAVPDFRSWTTGLGACILEALQHELAERWVASERSKGQVTDWNALRVHGRSQEAVLDAFLEGVESANRLDLARFLWQAAARLLTPDATAQLWVNAKASTGVRLADRVEAYRAALALVHRVDRFRQWEQRARGVGYFDEGYAASQLIKAEWERWGGDQLAYRAERIIREVDPMSLANEGRS
jgi:hypothetical protein